MSTKICTSIEQSKKLLRLGLDPGTADMCYPHFIRHGADTYNEIPEIAEDIDYPYEMPCWSLAALLNILPQEVFNGEYIINITEGHTNKWILTYDHYENEDHSYYDLFSGSDNLVDACVEMIIKLKELRML